MNHSTGTLGSPANMSKEKSQAGRREIYGTKQNHPRPITSRERVPGYHEAFWGDFKSSVIWLTYTSEIFSVGIDWEGGREVNMNTVISLKK